MTRLPHHVSATTQPNILFADSCTRGWVILPAYGIRTTPNSTIGLNVWAVSFDGNRVHMIHTQYTASWMHRYTVQQNKLHEVTMTRTTNSATGVETV